MSEIQDFSELRGLKVHLKQISGEEGMLYRWGVVYITPQIGDAGKHVVSLLVRACSGKVERVLTFKVKVQPATTN